MAKKPSTKVKVMKIKVSMKPPKITKIKVGYKQPKLPNVKAPKVKKIKY